MVALVRLKLFCIQMTVNKIIDTDPILRDALASGRGTKYKRLAEAMELMIQKGMIEPGAKLPTHRKLADRLGVTIGTVSRAYGELERMGLVVARVGDGTFARRRGLESTRDEGFRTFVDMPHEFLDMSRNMHIPGNEAAYLTQTLQNLASDLQTLQELCLYAPDAGLPRYRDAGARWLAHGDFTPNLDQVLCVNGGQHGLLCALMALLRAGDTLVTEQLTYPGLLTTTRFLGIKLLGIDMDEEGLIPESLEELCRANRVSALYCTPTIQNPTNGVLSIIRREVIAQICRQHNLLIIEDEAHGVLVEDRPPPLSMFAPERSLLISSFSKAVAAGLRVGYLHAPTALISRLSAALRSTCWMATPLVLELATIWVRNGVALKLMREQIGEISRRKELVTGLLAGLSYKTHPSSPHFWIEVPEPWRATEIESDLRRKNYLVTTAEAFAVGRTVAPQFVRASVSNSWGSDKRLYDGFLSLANALGATSSRFGI